MFKRYLIITALIWLLWAWQNFVYAEFWSNDCKIVLNGVDTAMEQFTTDVKWQWSTLVDQNTIKQATQNLSNHCNWVVWWAESNYIFDHLIDLWFRKLDAYTDDSLRYNIPADIKWKEWQKIITDFANPNNNTKPEQVLESFNTYWPLTEQTWTSYVPSSTCNIENVEKLSLYWKYKATCAIASCLAKKKVLVTQTITDETSAVRLQKDNEICNTLTLNRYYTEASYIKQLTARVGVRTINNLIEQYTKNYFVWNRRQSLYEQFTSFDQNLTFVNRKIQEGTPVCSSK
jgi:hypothetical protein